VQFPAQGKTLRKARLRKEQSLESARVGALDVGINVEVSEIAGNRVHVVKPTDGWISRVNTAGDVIVELQVIHVHMGFFYLKKKIRGAADFLI